MWDNIFDCILHKIHRVIEKLEAAGFMENDAMAVQTGGARGRKKTPTEGAPKAKRQLITRTESGGLPVEVRRTQDIAVFKLSEPQ